MDVKCLMAIIYYAKLNVNSAIFEVYDKKLKLSKILDKLFEVINDEVEYKKIHSFLQDTKKGLKEKEVEEIYCFSNINKVDISHRYITGSVVRRYPLFTEEYDEETRLTEKVVYENNAVSINFYFDVDNEIIVFCARQKFGQLQFLESFKELVNKAMETIEFEIFLIQDKLGIKERLKSVYKITKIKSVVIPPNVNEEHLEKLINKNVKSMKDANVTRKTSIFEGSSKNLKGINIDSEMVGEVLDTDDAVKMYKKGYGKIEVEGEHKDGSKFHYSSDKDSPYITIIDDSVKNVKNIFIKASQKGISILLAREIGR